MSLQNVQNGHHFVVLNVIREHHLVLHKATRYKFYEMKEINTFELNTGVYR